LLSVTNLPVDKGWWCCSSVDLLCCHAHLLQPDQDQAAFNKEESTAAETSVI